MNNIRLFCIPLLIISEIPTTTPSYFRVNRYSAIKYDVNTLLSSLCPQTVS